MLVRRQVAPLSYDVASNIGRGLVPAGTGKGWDVSAWYGAADVPGPKVGYFAQVETRVATLKAPGQPLISAPDTIS